MQNAGCRITDMLKGKTALITGGSRGIGRAIALEMAKSGANIALVYRGGKEETESVRDQVQKENVRCEIYCCDVADFAGCKTEIDAAVKDFGRIDILVNNAGITRDNLIFSMTEEDFDAVLDVNLKGAFNTVKHLYQHFIRNRAGAIINISSVIGLHGGAGQANYAASKGGLIALTKSVARELAARNVTCNAIAPGFIESEMTAKLSEETRRAYLNSVPLKRAGTTEDVARLAVFLASANAAYITGEVIRVDGGLYI